MAELLYERTSAGCWIHLLILFAEREVKKATRDLRDLLSSIPSEAKKLEAAQKRCGELLAEMKRVERDNIKHKKRADLLQKEKDHGRTELSKNVTLKEKLEKLCRELQRESNRLKVRGILGVSGVG